MKRAVAGVAVFLGLSLLVGAPVAQAKPKPAKVQQWRFAIVVASNKAPDGRPALQHTHKDARAVIDVLTQVGRFDVGDVDILYDRPPEAVLASLDRVISVAAWAAKKKGKKRAEVLLFFYYAGHADDAALYPQGLPLPLTELKRRLEDAKVKVRIAVVDSIHTGVPSGIAAAGAALIVSAAPAGNSGETHEMPGSFFTHHWNAALRGAGDQDGDGQITLGEASGYARTLSARDGARAAQAAQSTDRPAFRVNLADAADLALVKLPEQQPLLLQQSRGPLEVLELPSNQPEVETLPGRRKVALHLDPGRYLVRRREGSEVWQAEVEVPAKGQARLAESKLVKQGGAAPAVAVAGTAGAAKPKPRAVAGTSGAKPRPAAVAVVDDQADDDEADESLLAIAPRPTQPGLAAGHWNLQMGLGVRRARGFEPGIGINDVGPDLAGIFRGFYALTPRWHLALPLAFIYNGSNLGGWRWQPWIGIPSVATGNTTAEGLVISSTAGLGLDVRRPLGPTLDLDLGGGVVGLFRWALGPIGACDKTRDKCITEISWTSRPPRGAWSALVSGGLGWRPSDRLTFHLGLSVGYTLVNDGVVVPAPNNPVSDLIVALGSVQRRGLQPQPMLRYHLSDRAALDLHAVASYERVGQTIASTVLAGGSWMY